MDDIRHLESLVLAYLKKLSTPATGNFWRTLAERDCQQRNWEPISSSITRVLRYCRTFFKKLMHGRQTTAPWDLRRCPALRLTQPASPRPALMPIRSYPPPLLQILDGLAQRLDPLRVLNLPRKVGTRRQRSKRLNGYVLRLELLESRNHHRH